jgi:N-acyl-L-homoserine lactone synthetase
VGSLERIDHEQGPSGRHADLLSRVDYRAAETATDRAAVYQLRYRAYLKEGMVDPSPREMVSDRYDDLNNSWIIGVHIDGVLTSSLRITIGSSCGPGCPSMDVFSDLLTPLLAKGMVIVDPTRFVADPQAARIPELPYLTLRLATLACEHFGAQIGLASVRAEHQAFYRRVFMRPVAAPRDYPGLKKPIGLMSIDFPAQRERLYARYPFLRSTAAERQKLFARTANGLAPPLQSALASEPRPSGVPALSRG